MPDTALSRAAGFAALGLVAGLAGTIAMSVSQRAEMALTQRPPSETPVEAVETVTGIEVPDRARETVSSAAHVAFGTTLGLGLAAMARVPEPARGGLFLAGAWSLGAAILTGLGLSDPPARWTGRQLATDLAHHAVYAGAAAGAFAGLRRLFRS